MSSKVASACACPVMVIKRPRDEVGAFLTVLPRRVFFRIDSTAASRAAFDWATSYLLSPEIDEVFLMVSSRQQRPKAAGVGAWLQRGSRVTLQDSEAERIEIECMADYCQDTCIRKGLNASKVRLESGFFGGKCSQGDLSQQREVVALTRPGVFFGADMLREAELKSCDLLVVGKERRSTREDAALYAAHNAPFPVIVVGDTAEAEHRIAMESGAVTRVVSAASRAPRQAPHPPPQQRPRTAGACSDPRASQRRPSTPRRPLSRNGSLERMRMSMSRNSSAERVECTATLGPRSSSLERLLDTLADADHSAVMRSRRVRDGEEVRESECAPGNERRVPCVHQAAAGSAAGEDRRRRVAPGSSDTSSHDSSGSGGSRMRRVPTKAAFHASTVMPGDGNLEVAEVAKLSPSTLAAGGRDVPPALELGEPWMRGTNGPAAMLAM